MTSAAGSEVVRARTPYRFDALLSTVLVAAAIGVALLLGYGLKTIVEQRSESVTHEGFRASVPAGWLVEVSAGEPLRASNPREPTMHLSATMLPAGAADLASFAVHQTSSGRELSPGFVIQDHSPIRFGGREGVQVEYSYTGQSVIAAEPPRMSGLDLYLDDGTAIIVVGYEAPEHLFASNLDAFYRFAHSVERIPDQ